MRVKTALYPGSFDPVTLGHMDIITRAASLCDTLVVAVMHNPDKRGFMDVDARVAALQAACAHLPNVRVIRHGGLLVACARELGADAVIRGVRPLGDFETEFQMAQINRALGGVETLMIPTSPAYASVSSSVVRQIYGFGGSVEDMVPAAAREIIAAALAGGNNEGGSQHG